MLKFRTNNSREQIKIDEWPAEKKITQTLKYSQRDKKKKEKIMPKRTKTQQVTLMNRSNLFRSSENGRLC